VSSENVTQLPERLSVKVFNREGAEVGQVEVDPADFGGKINRQVLNDVVVMYLANQRAGTHSTLRRGEVAGSTKKLFRQKGTGNARVGPRRTNKRRGGGTAKGPKPRDYEYHLPKKVVRAATRMAILSKFRDNEAVIVEDLALPEVVEGERKVIKTKEMNKVVKALKLSDTTCLIGTTTPPVVGPMETDEARKTAATEARAAQTRLYLASRNIQNVKLMPAAEFNAYTVLRQKRLVLTRAALEELRQGPPKGVKLEKPAVSRSRKKVRGAKAKEAAKVAARAKAKKK
jgi:large subunit ribosomal protein L4